RKQPTLTFTKDPRKTIAIKMPTKAVITVVAIKANAAGPKVKNCNIINPTGPGVGDKSKYE
ncbi:hypothetical protein MNBD_GAMMA12-789, partial [hydrothermal vent metagenome]